MENVEKMNVYVKLSFFIFMLNENRRIGLMTTAYPHVNGLKFSGVW